MSKILHKRNSSPGVGPETNELDLGELAINTADGTLYTKTDLNGVTDIVVIGPNPAPTGLEALNEGNGVGWRLIGENPNNHDYIGNHSIDFSAGIQGQPGGAGGDYSFAAGRFTDARGSHSTAFGYGSQALGNYSLAEGFLTRATNTGSHAEGGKAQAHGSYSHAEGISTIANGDYSHAEGNATSTDGQYSHAEGFASEARGDAAHAEGYSVIAQNNYMHAEGIFNVGTATDTIHETGIGFVSSGTITRKNAFEIYTDGTLTAPEATIALINSRGNTALATKEYVDAQTSSGKTPTGLELIDGAYGGKGWRLVGRDPAYYALIGSQAVDISTSRNPYTTIGGATGYSSFAQGVKTTASGNSASAFGYLTTAKNAYSTSIGIANEATSKDTIFEVGIGLVASGVVAETLNGFEVYKDGRVIAPELTPALINTNNSLVTKEYVDANSGSASELEKITEGSNTGWRLLGQDPSTHSDIGRNALDFTTAMYINDSGASGPSSVAFGFETKATGNYSFVSGIWSEANGYASQAMGKNSIASGGNSHAEGYDTRARGEYSHAENYKTEADGEASHAEGSYTSAPGNFAHAEGGTTTASGISSHAEGSSTIASGDHSHAEGRYSKAIGISSHTEGESSEANDRASHAEGYGTKANGEASHAEGRYTVAQNNYMHAAGIYNVGTATDTIHETGIGYISIGGITRKNAFEIYTDGTLTAPEATIALINARGDSTLTTKEYVDDSISGGITAARFTDLSDTPGALAADKWLKVDSTGNYLEWVDNTGGVNVINDLQDVVTTTPIYDDHYLGYDLASNTWVNKTIQSTDISDFDIPQNPNNGDVLTYNSSTQQWETGIISGGTF